MPASEAKAAGRIVIVMHDFPAGGTERIMIRLANAWSRRGRDVTIICGDEHGPARERVATTVRVRRTSPDIPRSMGSRRRLGRAVSAILRNDTPDVVVGPGNFHLPVLHAMRRLPVPLVCKLSNPLVTRERSQLATRLFAWTTRHRARELDLLVAMSPALAEEARRVVGDVPVACVFEPNFPDDQPAPPRRDPAWPPRLLCAGRLAPQKRFDLALRAFAALGAKGATLTIAGDGPERAALVELARQLGVRDAVHFTGAQPDIAPLLAQSDLLLLTSAYEGYPAVLLEALAAGLPVVTTPSSPAIDEILLDPSFGRVAAPEACAIVDAIAVVARGAGPDARSLALLVDRHREGRSADAWLAVLDEVAATGRRSAPA